MKKFDKKRNEIKEAGIKMFATYGYYKTTLEDIASLLKMKKNSLYYYFESKEALFKELILDEINAHIKEQRKILEKKIPASKKLQEALESLIKFIHKRSLKYAIKLDSYFEISEVIRNSFPDFKDHECKIFVNLLNEGIKSGEFKKHNSKQLAEDLHSLVMAVLSHKYYSSHVNFLHEVDYKSISLLIKRMIQHIIDGIKVNK